jgi:hypothetical protein
LATINLGWYASNATRAYPLDDVATARDDAGQELPPQILVDCRVKFPLAMGRFAYISAVTVSPNIVTVILMATADTIRPAGGVPSNGIIDQPLGAVSVPMPVQPYRHYPIQPMATGVGGWVVFGQGVDEPYSGRFSKPSQSILLPRVASAYYPLPIPTLAKLNTNPPLTGVVLLLGATDLEVIQDTREIEGGIVDAIIIRLIDNLNRNVYQFYSGPCAGRPESGTCNKPVIETINGVLPDCNGNLTIDFTGINTIDFEDGGGIALDLALGMAETCTGQDYLPDNNGKLPNEYEGGCAPTGILGLPSGCVVLPYCESFDGAIPSPWQLKSGTFAVEDGDSPKEPCGLATSNNTAIDKSYAAVDQNSFNMVLWNCNYDVSGQNLVLTTHFKLVAGDQLNAGFIVNYVYDPVAQKNTCLLVAVQLAPNNPEETYLNGHMLYTYDGTNVKLTAYYGFQTGNYPKIGEWYQLTCVISHDPAFGGFAPPYNLTEFQLATTVSGITDPDFQPVTADWKCQFLYPGGKVGLGALNAHSLFSFFQIEEAMLDCSPLPYYENFDSYVPAVWATPSGIFAIEEDDSPDEPFSLEAPGSGVPPGEQVGLGGTPPFGRATRTEPPTGVVLINRSFTAADTAHRNVAFWDCHNYDITTQNLTVKTSLKMLTGAQMNGGIVIYFELQDPVTLLTTYLIIGPNLVSGYLEMSWYNGYTITRVDGVPFILGNSPKAEQWYHLECKIYPDPAFAPSFHNYIIETTLSGVTDTTFKTMVVDFKYSFTEAGTKVGLGSNNAHTRFSWFELEVTP